LPATEFTRLTLLEPYGGVLVEGTFSGLDVTNPALEVTLHFQIIQGGEAVAVGETTVKAPGTDFDWEGEAAAGTRRATDGDALALGFAVIVKPPSFETHTWSQIKPIEPQASG
jgi:hypothetical protein